LKWSVVTFFENVKVRMNSVRMIRK
jgi:hypothetical protein